MCRTSLIAWSWRRRSRARGRPAAGANLQQPAGRSQHALLRYARWPAIAACSTKPPPANLGQLRPLRCRRRREARCRLRLWRSKAHLFARDTQIRGLASAAVFAIAASTPILRSEDAIPRCLRYQPQPNEGVTDRAEPEPLQYNQDRPEKDRDMAIRKPLPPDVPS